MTRNFITVIIFTLFLFLRTDVLAKEATEAGIATTSAQKIDYQLPYHGILPDSPIYFLRALRDKIIDFLTQDALKKSEFYLLQADKRLSAGVALAERGKNGLAVTTISKGENYLEMAIIKLGEAYKKGQDANSVGERIKQAVNKHEEVLLKLGQIGLEKEIQRVGVFKNSVRSFGQ